jgi:hypothetical protein
MYLALASRVPRDCDLPTSHERRWYDFCAFRKYLPCSWGFRATTVAGIFLPHHGSMSDANPLPNSAVVTPLVTTALDPSVSLAKASGPNLIGTLLVPTALDRSVDPSKRLRLWIDWYSPRGCIPSMRCASCKLLRERIGTTLVKYWRTRFVT